MATCNWTHTVKSKILGSRTFNCVREATHGDKCIFHADENEKDETEFCEELKKLIDIWRRGGDRRCDFSGFVIIGDKDFVFDFYNNRRDLHKAFFVRTSFKVKTDFSNTYFNEFARFEGAQFYKEVSFRDAHFMKWARFHDAEFRDTVDLWGVTFNEYASFERCSFFSTVDMSYCSFSILGDFKDCSICGQVRIAWPGDGKKRNNAGELVHRGTLSFLNLQINSPNILDLSNNSLQEDSELLIENCPMSRIRLMQTDCVQIEFLANTWLPIEDEFNAWFVRGLPRNWRRSKRDAIGDEYLHSKNEYVDFKPKLIRLNYLQLSKNFRQELDHPRANEFDRGAFEMRRLEAFGEWKQKEGGGNRFRGWTTYVGLSIYKYLSHYSGNTILPIIWLFIITIIIGWIYTLCLPDNYITFNPSKADWKSIKQVYINTIQVLNLGKPEDGSLLKGSIGIELLKLFQRAFSATMITLFIFAIRRRFKH